jgi:hypothetical protein
VIGPKPITGADVSIVVPRSYRPVTPTEQGEATCPAIDA